MGEGEIYRLKFYRKVVYSIRGMMKSSLVIPRSIRVGVVALAKISDAAIPRPSAVVRDIRSRDVVDARKSG
jgi:hypothetical protein